MLISSKSRKAVVLGAAALMLTACSQGSDSGAPSVAWIKEKARVAGAAGASKCPVPFDIAAAAKAAGYNGGAGAGTEHPAATGFVDGASDTPTSQADGAMLECVYRLDSRTLHVYTVGAGKGPAVGLLYPRLAADAGMTSAEMTPWLNKAVVADRGRTVPMPGRTVVTERLPMEGAGDVALTLSLGEHAKADPLLERLTKELAAQAKP
ncbi:hypothetical protein ABZX93_18765 [Streptomyces sp. NPDC006632]|uniref:hypothetical protein n=1 Tax=Streptomyces sp. NPDC006632 TaxID=3157182 RepID=UPI0033AE4DBD